MHFPPIKPDRALLTITLRPDAAVQTRYEALRTLLKQCRLHPFDTTPVSEIVIVETAAFEARVADIQAALGEGDMLHLVAAGPGGRLRLSVLAGPDGTGDPLAHRPPPRQPPWLRR
jgi:hypothetical protein